MGHRRLFLLFQLFVFLLASSSTSQAGGVHDGQAAATIITQQGVGSMMRSMVGSRPPSCLGRCWWCSGRRRRCEAVQVPVAPKELLQPLIIDKGGHGGRREQHSSLRHPSSYDDRSNYKPLSWRCKCGELILNP